MPKHMTPAAAGAEVPLDELGVWALPEGASAEQRAQAEALWRPNPPELPCRCSGGSYDGVFPREVCDHGGPCPGPLDELDAVDEESEEVDEERCPGRLVHVDRRPGSVIDPRTWTDLYVCSECGEESRESIGIEGTVWGEVCDNGKGYYTIVFPGTRHPGMRADGVFVLPPANGECRRCGEFTERGLLCEDCRTAGWSDAYGTVTPPPHLEPLSPTAMYFAPPEGSLEHAEDCPAAVLHDASCPCGANARRAHRLKGYPS